MYKKHHHQSKAKKAIYTWQANITALLFTLISEVRNEEIPCEPGDQYKHCHIESKNKALLEAVVDLISFSLVDER